MKRGGPGRSALALSHSLARELFERGGREIKIAIPVADRQEARRLLTLVRLNSFLLIAGYVLRLVQIGVATRDRDVEYPLVPFFFRFYQALLLQRHHVVFHPRDLLLAHAAALNIDRNACKMGGSGFALFRRCIAIVAAKFFLYLHGSHRRIDLNRIVKLFVISLAQIVEKVARPRTAITAIRIKPRIESQSLAGDDRNQFLTADQLFELSFILNPRQFQPIDLLILAQQRIVRRAEYRVPKDPANTSSAFAGAVRVPRGHDLMQTKSLSAHHGGQKH